MAKPVKPPQASDPRGPIRPLILGTAGHIDHGKTLLIKLLSGTDTDRLVEEKKRGISIELGFASLTTPGGHKLGIVDVPGHERFIRAMLAGAAGIDVILFIIAADEGVMPQTREHMDIIELLGINRGVIALTKIDLVDDEWLELVTEEVREYLQKTPLAGAPIVPISSVTGAGKDELLAAIDELIPQVELEERGRFPRLPVDRIFIMEGFGTVVTGTLWAGRLREGDPVWIFPQGIETRIKALQVHGERVPEAVAGQRTAVSLHAVEKEALSRGDWVTSREDAEPHQMVDAKVRCLSSAPRELKNGSRIRFHLGAAEVLGRLILIDRESLAPGQEGWAQIRLETPILAERGDRFVIRSYSPAHTIAGGTVVLAENKRRRRHRAEDLDTLKVAEKGTPEERVTDSLRKQQAKGHSMEELCRAVGQSREEVVEIVEGLVKSEQVLIVGKDHLVLPEAVDSAGDLLKETLSCFQKENPLRWGMTKSELKSRLSDRIHPHVVELWVQRMLDGGRLFARKDRLRWDADDIKLTPELQELREKVLDDLLKRGFVGPHQKELLEAVTSNVGAKTAKIAPELVALLMEEGAIVRVPPDILFHCDVVKKVPEAVEKYFASGKTEMSIAQFKDILGVSRKQAVPLLEYLDKERYTMRQGDVRTPGTRLSRGED
ncbi:MAG: selenocysteine-specific translation elongation factor [Candidatus Eisenbacteria bacterium]|uniref:Selenocysteine-specific elongation factor n=1 Tax=Eiseniibacteriota bacterium TaxID=2212470 RepID=A0A948RTZ8_UNCEI|nr:selenocysteine-specific translation elongation factor [Candidatus Eisenbacteria bacterium]MBU1947977.1 selenocysteine-specific translation elongation factor [Candidatus Eisenbacteria bacterium]MBU2689533.1 selenocysteine-specific translation elongation factor [Candidatus Eisenbacteria bacterium]